MKKDILRFVLLPLLLSGAIYWAARPSILAFNGYVKPLFDIQSIPNWFVFNLPDGLWSYSLISFTLILWRNNYTFYAKFWLITAFLLGIILEIGQYLHLISGTFDWLDIVIYIVFNIFSIFQFKPKIYEK